MQWRCSTRDRRLAFHNGAFAELWALEQAWLAERPSHAEWLDRLRQRRRLPETVDYAAFKARELARHGELEASPETIWRLPDERTLRVVGQPHPEGGLTMLFSDITPELRLKAQFNHLIQVQKATLDKLTDAVAVFGADARLKLHNEAFERFWEVSPEQLGLALDFDGVVELCRRRAHDLQFWRDLKGRITDPDPRARAAISGELETADRRIVAHQSRPLPDGATLISFADVTDTRRLEGALADREVALAETERLKREFVGSVSYELRTPLTTILGYSELLEREAEDIGARRRGHIGAIRLAATQLGRSINDVLAMAEIDAGEMTLEVEDVDVSGLIAAAVTRWSGEAGEAAVTLGATAGGAAPGLIRGDPHRLAEVIDHLTENALRHTPPGGAVTLSAEQAPGEVRLQVADTGRGIPFHVQAHIFDRFSGQDQGGAGLGLALVKALVELHGGWVALESEPGAGATFTCHLPELARAPDGRPELFLSAFLLAQGLFVPYSSGHPYPEAAMTSKTMMLSFVKAHSWREADAALTENPGLLAIRDERGRNWLHIACGVEARKADFDIEGSIRTAETMIAHGLDVNDWAFAEAEWKATPLWYAIGRGRNLPLAEYLLGCGASPDHCLWAAVYNNDIEAIRLLARHGADLEARADDATPFLWAVQISHFGPAEELLKFGANPDAAGAKGVTALHAMLKKSSDKTHFAMLAAYGARGDIPDASGRTAADLLRRKKDPDFHALADKLRTGA